MTTYNTNDLILQATSPRVITNSIVITSTNGVTEFSSPGSVAVISPDSITLTATPQGYSSPTYLWEYAPSGLQTTWVRVTVLNNTYTNTLVVSSADYVAILNTGGFVTYRCTVSQNLQPTTKSTIDITRSVQSIVGQNAVIGVLSNESATIPASNSGVVSTYAGAATTLSIFNGYTDDSATWTYAVTKSSGVTCTESIASRIQTVTGLSDGVDNGYIEFVASKIGYPTITKRFIITKAKTGANGVAYWLVVSAAAIQKNISTNTFTPNTLTVNAYSSAGSTVSPYLGRFKIYENGSATASYTSASNESSKIWPATGTIASTTTSIKAELYLIDGTTKLDEQTVPIVYDGLPGLPGTDGTIYYITASSPVISKDAKDAASSGAHTQITVTGTKILGSTVTTNVGFITITANSATEAATAIASPITTTILDNDGKSSYTIRLYSTANKASLYDTQVVPVVFKTAVDGLTSILTNDSHTIPTDSSGGTPVYTNSGTDIYLYEGGATLTYDGIGTALSTWKVTATGVGIIPSTPTDSGSYATYGPHNTINPNSDTAYISYRIIGVRANGMPIDIIKTQTFSKSKGGQAATISVGTVTTGTASVSNSGTSTSATLNFTIPQGNPGNSIYTATVYWQTATAPTAPSGGTYNFSNGVLTAPTNWVITQPATSTTPTYACEYTFTGVPATGNITAGTWTNVHIEAVAGTNGEYRDIVQLYSNTTSTVPTNISYTFSSNTIAAYTGWSLTQPASSTNPTYLTTCFAATTTPTTAVALTAWTPAVIVAQNGTPGTPGNSIYTATVYQQIATAPAAPTAGTYNFSTGVLTAPASWTITQPATSTTPTYACEYTFIGATGNITAATWTNVHIEAVAGTNGTNGNSARIMYAKAISTTTFTAGSTDTTAGASSYPDTNSHFGVTTLTWQALPPTIVASESLFQSDGIYSPTTTNTIWNTPYLSSLKVGSLSAISANLGTITAGSISGTSLVVNTAGSTAPTTISTGSLTNNTMSGAGTIISSNGNFSLGNSTTNITFNGTTMYLNGNVVATGNIQANAITTEKITTGAVSNAVVTDVAGDGYYPGGYTYYNASNTYDSTLVTANITLTQGSRVLIVTQGDWLFVPASSEYLYTGSYCRLQIGAGITPSTWFDLYSYETEGMSQYGDFHADLRISLPYIFPFSSGTYTIRIFLHALYQSSTQGRAFKGARLGIMEFKV